VHANEVPTEAGNTLRTAIAKASANLIAPPKKLLDEGLGRRFGTDLMAIIYC